MNENYSAISAEALREALEGEDELAIIDFREEGSFAPAHLLHACNVPLSRLELEIRGLVPRVETRIVATDNGEGLAERGAARLREFGYTNIVLFANGVEAWRRAGYEVFSGFNVPSKAFGEYVEHAYDTPSVSAEELRELLDGSDPVVVLDSRPMDEFRNMNIPTGTCCPGAELVYRVHDLAPSPETTVIVNCAGRTRSIIGAQSLINAGIPNRVAALRNGTMGWHLAGLQLERGNERPAPEPSAAGAGGGARLRRGGRGAFRGAGRARNPARAGTDDLYLRRAPSARIRGGASEGFAFGARRAACAGDRPLRGGAGRTHLSGGRQRRSRCHDRALAAADGTGTRPCWKARWRAAC